MTGTDPLDVLVLPDYTDVNPYQRLLADGFDPEAATVTVASPAGAKLPVVGAVRDHGGPDLLHLHFLSQFVVASDDLPRPLVPPVSLLLTVRFLLELLLVRLMGVPVVWTVHDRSDHGRPAPRVETLARSLAARWFVDEFVLHCETAVDDVVAAYRLPAGARERMTVVPHGPFEYETTGDRASARRELDLPEDAFVYLFFGSVKRYKNVTGLVDAFRRSAPTDARLVVAGSPADDALAAAVRDRAAGDDRVRTVLERVPDDDVGTYMTAADAVVLPFEADHGTLLTSGSLVLAMGFGRPVVTTAQGCNPAMLTDEGSCYAPWPPTAGEARNDGGERSGGPVAGATDRPTAGTTGVCVTDGGVLYGRDAALSTALDAVRRADCDRMGARNAAAVDGLDWDLVAARTLAVYREAAGATGPTAG